MNLAQTSIEGSALLIKEQGLELMNSNYLSVIYSDAGAAHVRNIRYDITFNHEVGLGWVNSDYEALKKRYSGRLHSLRDAFGRGRRVFFHYSDMPGDLSKIVQSFCDLDTHREYTLVIVDSGSAPRSYRNDHSHDVRYLHVTKPRPDYVWFKPDEYDDEQGAAFERTIQSFVLSAAALD